MDSNIKLTSDGLLQLASIMRKPTSEEIGIIVQVTNVRFQDQQKPMYKCHINDENCKTNAVFLHSDSIGRLENFDVVKINAIFSQGAGGKGKFLIAKKFIILAKNQRIRNIDPEAIPLISDILDYYDNLKNNSNSNLNNNPHHEEKNINQIQDNPQSYYNNNQNMHDNSSRKTMYLPLATLSTFSKEIVIKVRVTKKFEKKSFNNAQTKKQGTVFSFNVIDDEGTELPCSAFNKPCEMFYDTIQENDVYEIRGGYIKINDKKYSTIKSDYKYFLDEKTIINPLDDDGSIEKNKCNFIKIDRISEAKVNGYVDIIAKIIQLNEKQAIRTKKGDERDLRKMTIADDSGYKIELAIWGKGVNSDFEEGKVYAFKGLKVSEFKGEKNLTFGDNSVLLEDFNSKEMMDVQISCESINNENFRSLPMNLDDESSYHNAQNKIPIKTLKDINNQLEGISDEKEKIPICRIKGTITNCTLNEKSFYEGCPQCKKKISFLEGSYNCPNCNKQFEKPHYYYSFNFRTKDFTSEIYLDILGNIGEKLLGLKCQDMKDFDERALKKLSSSIEFKTYYFTISPKVNFYNGVSRKRYALLRFEEVTPNEEFNRLSKNMIKHLNLD